MYLPIYAMFSTQSLSSGHLVRSMAITRGASQAFIDGRGEVPTVKEHVDPANDMAALMVVSYVI